MPLSRQITSQQHIPDFKNPPLLGHTLQLHVQPDSHYAILTYMPIWHIIYKAKENQGNTVRIISKKKIRIYGSRNAQAKLPLLEWYLKMLAVSPKNLTALKRFFNSVDYAHGYTIFDIGGNNYRLISAIHYNTQICYIRTIMTHAEYSKPQNQIKLSRGEL